MNLQQTVGRLKAQDLTLDPGVTPEEAQQLDLLLGELSEHEQALTPSYWASQAQILTDRVATYENGKNARRAARYARLKPYLGSLLPLGGLVALGLVLLRPQPAPVALVAPNESVALVAIASTVDIAATEALAVRNEATNGLPVAPDASAQVQREPDVTQKRVTTRPTPKKSVPVRAPVLPDNTTPAAVTTAASSPAQSNVADAARSQTVLPSPRANSSATIQAPETDTFAAQLQALKRADKALKSNDNAAARTALSRSFSPQFGLHVNALRAVLACQTHDASTGKRYLEAQAKSHPNSPYLDRMRRACGVTSFGNSTASRQK